MTTSSKPWLAHYEPGVPAEINPAEYDSLVDLLDQSFKQFARRDMAAFMGAHYTYEQVDDMSRAMRRGCNRWAWPKALAWP